MTQVKQYGILCLCGIFLGIALAGCARKTRVVTRPREDQAFTGNRGFLSGTPPPMERTETPTRTYYETEVEVPTFEVHITLPPWRREWHDKELSGNRGYLMGGYQMGEASEGTSSAVVVSPPPAEKPSFFQKLRKSLTPEQPPVETKEITYDTYTVKKGETLGAIAARPEIYGTSREWKRIYEANQHILGDPNRIKAGQVLLIPRGGESSKASRPSTIK